MIGQRLGSYEVLGRLGEGGMGEVYRARDTKLGRDVAIKLLPPVFTADPDRLARFEREAQALAAINHPNVATIYGIEEAGDLRAIVMELVEGETLAELLARAGRLQIGKALDAAVQIADALDTAHEKGVVHRDLKPANIKITPTGIVKVLDFGLARFMSAAAPLGTAPGSAGASAMTAMVDATAEGVVLGTAPYMSPEQARGQAIDKRTDIWAFGCVLFEALSGRRAFSGASSLDTLAAIVEREPQWDALPADTPVRVRHLLKRCLEKDPRRRLRDIGDARSEIEQAVHEPALPTVPTRIPSLRAFAAGLVCLIAGAVGGFVAGRQSAPRELAQAQEMRLDVSIPNSSPTDFAISPDGGRIVATVSTNGVIQLWLRRLASGTSEPLAGTEGGERPFWSPDGRSIGFFTNAQLKRIDLDSGLVRSLAPVNTFAVGGAWGAGDTILFATTNGPLWRVSANGGSPTEATRLGSRQSGHRFPRFLPGGRDFIFFGLGSREGGGLFRGSLSTLEIDRIAVDADSLAEFVPPDRLVFSRGGALWIQRIDVKDMRPIGDAMAIATRVGANANINGDAAFSTASNGSVAYRVHLGVRQLAWLDRTGREVGVLGEPDEAQPRAGSLSPDGQTVALARTVDGNQDVWLADTTRGVLRRFTTDPASDNVPSFSPDGRYRFSRRCGPEGSKTSTCGRSTAPAPTRFSWNLRRARASTASHPMAGISCSWTSMRRRDSIPRALPLGRTARGAPMPVSAPVPVLQTPFNELLASVSPDGRWLAYCSDETGKRELYVRPFLRPGEKVRISVDGGFRPVWRSRGGGELYYTSGSRLMAVPVDLTRAVPVIGNPVRLFTVPAGSAWHDVSADGQRFLVSKVVADAAPITLLVNWRPPQQ